MTDSGEISRKDSGESAIVTTTVSQRSGMFGGNIGGDTSGFAGMQKSVEMVVSTPRPYGGYYDEIIDSLESSLNERGRSKFVEAIASVAVVNGELTVHVHRDHLLEVLQTLRDEPQLRFEMGLSVCAAHFPEHEGHEFHVYYHLMSITHGNRRVMLQVDVPESDQHLLSGVSIYPGLDWHERETWDMFGLVFDGHPGLTRILMPDDWPGHPQRKDYPLGGIPVQFKGATTPPADHRRSYH